MHMFIFDSKRNASNLQDVWSAGAPGSSGGTALRMNGAWHRVPSTSGPGVDPAHALLRCGAEELTEPTERSGTRGGTGELPAGMRHRSPRWPTRCCGENAPGGQCLRRGGRTGGGGGKPRQRPGWLLAQGLLGSSSGTGGQRVGSGGQRRLHRRGLFPAWARGHLPASAQRWAAAAAAAV